MANQLYPIYLQKQCEVAELYQLILDQPNHPIAQIFHGKKEIQRKKSFKAAMKREILSIIAEIKRKSPSRGLLAPIENPVNLAKKYLAGGANALSILTDEIFFGGSLKDLTQVAESSLIPLLRKDFIIDEIQMAEAVYAGADAVLCIIALVGERAQALLDFAKKINVDVLVEVHDKQELDIALKFNAEIIGVNNRDLTTFLIDPERALELVEHMPESVIRIAESGITSPVTAQQYRQAGFDAVLIGEALVTSLHPEDFIQACQNV